MITCPHCGKEFKAENQAKGGRKSKRTISPEDQAKLQEARRLARILKEQTQRMLVALNSGDLSDITPEECVEVSRGNLTTRAKNLYGEFSNALEHMKMHELVEVNPNGFVILTDAGIKEAKKIK